MATSTSGCDASYCAEISDDHAENSEPFAEVAVDSAEQTGYFTEESDRIAKLSVDGDYLTNHIADNSDDYAA